MKPLTSATTAPFKQLRVAVIGGGLGGLSAAVALRRAGHIGMLETEQLSFWAFISRQWIFTNGVISMSRLGHPYLVPLTEPNGSESGRSIFRP